LGIDTTSKQHQNKKTKGLQIRHILQIKDCW